MSCPTCNNGNGPIVVGGLSQILATVNSPCTTALCPNPQDTKCTFYSAANLPCSGINTGDTLEVALQKIDTGLCATSGNYSGYNTACLAPISTQQQFVEKISQYVCNTNNTLSVFIGTTFPAYQTTVSQQFQAIQTPGTTSACANILPINLGDSIQSVLQKLSGGICSIYNTQLVNNISNANWNSCNTINPIPTDLLGAFNAIIAQICSLQNNQQGPLPTFDNTNSCLPNPTTSDTLVSTIAKLKSVACAAPIYNGNSLNWNCVAKPTGLATSDLTTALNAFLGQIDALSQKIPSFNGSQFSVVATNPSAPCQGVTVSLNSTIADRKVAATANDNSAGTLDQKLIGDGTTIQVDYTSVSQGVVRLIGSAGGPGNGKVMADSTDSTADYLISKLENSGVASGIGIVFNLDTTNAYHKVQPTVTVDPVSLFTALLNAVNTDSTGTLQSLICAIVASCPSPCAAPTNVSVVYNPSTTTTTTTTIAPSTTTTTTTTSGGPTTSTTTTTTTTLATIFFGAQSSATPPNGTTIGSSSNTQQNPVGNVSVDWTALTASTPLYCWAAIPSAYIKTIWYCDALNNGTIGGGGSTFANPTIVSVGGVSYGLYFTNFATQFTEICLLEP